MKLFICYALSSIACGALFDLLNRLTDSVLSLPVMHSASSLFNDVPTSLSNVNVFNPLQNTSSTSIDSVVCSAGNFSVLTNTLYSGNTLWNSQNMESYNYIFQAFNPSSFCFSAPYIVSVSNTTVTSSVPLYRMPAECDNVQSISFTFSDIYYIALQAADSLVESCISISEKTGTPYGIRISTNKIILLANEVSNQVIVPQEDITWSRSTGGLIPTINDFPRLSGNKLIQEYSTDTISSTTTTTTSLASLIANLGKLVIGNNTFSASPVLDNSVEPLSAVTDRLNQFGSSLLTTSNLRGGVPSLEDASQSMKETVETISNDLPLNSTNQTATSNYIKSGLSEIGNTFMSEMMSFLLSSGVEQQSQYQSVKAQNAADGKSKIGTGEKFYLGTAAGVTVTDMLLQIAMTNQEKIQQKSNAASQKS